MNTDGKYNMKAVSNLLGIQPETLRAWERRYHIIAPTRNQAGHRLYSDKHLMILRWVMDKVNKGFTISQAVRLYEKENLTQEREREGHVDPQQDRLVEQLLQALLGFKEKEALAVLDRCFSLFSPMVVLIDLFQKVRVKMRHMQESQACSMIQVAFIDRFLQVKLVYATQVLPIQTSFPTVVVCHQGEKDMLDVQMFTYFLRHKGFPVIDLEITLSEEVIHTIVKDINPDFVLIFGDTNIMKQSERFEALINRDKAKVYCRMIGQSFVEPTNGESSTYERYRIGTTTAEWERSIQELGL